MPRFSLIAELDKKREITSRLAGCFKDYRDPSKVLHPINSLIAQRIYGLIMGYEDINDHEALRHDPIFAVAVGKAINKENQSNILAGKSTLNRLEHCPEHVSNKADSRYHRIEHDAESIKTLLVELFLESYRKPPRQIILDLDVTDDLIHGNQEETFFNTYSIEPNKLPCQFLLIKVFYFSIPQCFCILNILFIRCLYLIQAYSVSYFIMYQLNYLKLD